jgi:phosphoadenosine phosphosulfate reductase
LLIEHDLFRGRIDRVQIAIDRLKMFEPEEGYYLAYSGGKDSDTILALAKMAGVKFDAHFQRSMEPPEVVYHVRKHPEVQIHLPEMTMWKLIQHKSMPPTRLARFCCQYMKERGGSGRVVLTGVRREESVNRKKRHMTDVCYTDPTKRYLHPVIDWTSEDVWEFIRTNNVPYCKLYDEGFDRIGCVLCPFSKPRDKLRDMNVSPRLQRHIEGQSSGDGKNDIPRLKKVTVWLSISSQVKTNSTGGFQVVPRKSGPKKIRPFGHMSEVKMKAIYSDAEVQFIPMKEQPPDDNWYCDRYNHTDWWCFWGKKGTDVVNKCCLPEFKAPYRSGEKCYLREGWLSVSDDQYGVGYLAVDTLKKYLTAWVVTKPMDLILLRTSNSISNL